MTYDGNGNITTDHRGQTYVYAADNQLKTVKTGGGTTLAAYFYNADGTMRKRTGGGADNSYYYDGGQEIADYATGGSLERRYVRIPGSVDEAFLMIDYASTGCGSGCAVYAHSDARGSTVATSDASGDIIDAYTYSPYGESGPEGDAGFPFRFTGQKLDAATGLYYYKARFYDPETGRFLQTDPIGYGDGMNIYAYVGNDPVNATDPSGLAKCSGRVSMSCGVIYSSHKVADEEGSGGISNRISGSSAHTVGVGAVTHVSSGVNINVAAKIARLHGAVNYRGSRYGFNILSVTRSC